MKEQGKIIKLSEDTKKATVRFERKDACAKCNACGAFKPNNPHIDLEVDNSLNAKVNDSVEIDMTGINGLKLSLIVYVVPLINAFIGMFIAMALKDRYLESALSSLNFEIFVMIVFVVMLAIGFAIVKSLDIYFTKHKLIKPLMISIINDKGE